jgi:triphosphoribosyl-dephospho-CoA synthetase
MTALEALAILEAATLECKKRVSFRTLDAADRQSSQYPLLQGALTGIRGELSCGRLASARL